MNLESFAALTEGERDCLRLVARGFRSKEIAPHLGISHHTVDARLKKALKKLGYIDRVEAARTFVALESGHQPLVHQSAPLPPEPQVEPEVMQPFTKGAPETITAREEQRPFVLLPVHDHAETKLAGYEPIKRGSALSTVRLFVMAVLALGIGFAGFTDAMLRGGAWVTRFLLWLEHLW